ncbi:MAG: PhnE/PtxC family ABC transporter permease [Eggerthellaceae bacterium]
MGDRYLQHDHDYRHHGDNHDHLCYHGALFLGLAAARNLSNNTVSNIVKGFIAIIRAIPTILWVLVFTVAIGLGSEAAVLGISLHSLAYLTKSYSETFEEVNEGTIEALRATGGSFWQIVFQAILPATVTQLISWTFIRLEINFANAVAVGAFAGAGGIGFQLFQAGSRYYNLHEVGVIVYACVLVAFALEFCSTRLRRRYIVNE